MKKAFKSALALTLAFSMMAGTAGSYVQAEETAAQVSIGKDQISIGNGQIAREFSIENGKIKTSTVLNKRIGTELEPQEGSQDFLISTVSSGSGSDAEDGVITNDPQWVYPATEPISTEGWSAKLTNGSGQEFSASDVSKLFDGSTDTYIDQWSISGLPFTLDIDFGEEKTISSMSVDKRPGYSQKAYGINGTMGDYEIWTSEDGENYTKVTEGSFTEEDYNLHEANGLYNVGDTVYAVFDEITTQYVRVIQKGEALSSAEEFSSSEVDFYAEAMEKTQKVVNPENALDRSNWKVTIKNSAGTAFDEENTSYLTDGDLNTYPDAYTISGHPITVDINLGEAKTVRSFSIDKRPGYQDPAYGTNGTMGSFQLYVSEDGEEYTLAGAGEFTEEAYNLHEEGGLYNVGDRVYANFHKPYTAQYIRLVQTGVALGTAQEFSSAELNLYEDQYVGSNWNKEIVVTQQNQIASGELTYENAVEEDVEGGKKLTINYAPYELEGVTYDIAQVFVLKDQDAYMRSFLEITVSDMDKAQIDYIDTDRFVLPEDVEGLWCHPEESKVSSMWIGQHELMLGQPIYANGFYMGSEFPAADTVVKDNATQIRYYSGKTFTKLKEDKQLTTDDKFVSWQNVIGAAQGTEMEVVQTDFFAYIEEIATPTDFRKQYNSWYDNMMNITDESIAASFNGAEAGLTQNGVEPLDAYVVDDGWNNYYSVIGDKTYVSESSSSGTGTPNQTGFWEFNEKFPNELYTSSALSDKFQSAFGLWLGPQGGYNYFSGFAQYLEAMGTGYAQNDYWTNVCVGSDRYVKNLTNLFVDYENRFNIDYWKWDGFSLRPCTNASHDHMTGGENNMYYTTDLWEKWIDLFTAARAARAAEGKGLFINATCYVNLSPWLLQWVNTIWVQDSGDTGQIGTGERHEQKIYYRDQVYYQLYKQNQVQFPLKNIYNHDPIYGVSDSSNATTEVFREYLFANAVRGTAFWELYFSPSLMDDAKWKVVSDALAWAEENHDVLKNAKLFGNQPKNGVYGYSSWNGTEGIVSFTNPLDTAQTYELTMNEIVGVTKAVKELTGVQVEPYAEGTLEKTLSYGDTLTVTLQPHETLIYQFGHEDDKAPELVSAKTTGENEITLKFSERIQNGQFTVNGKEVSAELKEDYRTVVLTIEESLKETNNVTASVADFFGNDLQTKADVVYYENNVIAEAENTEDLKNAADVTVVVDEETENTWMNLEKAYTIDTNNELSGTEDFTLSLKVKTESTDAELLTLGNDVTLGIDSEGFAVFKVNGLTLTSKEEVTTVVEKAHGTFGTDAYVPTTSKTEIAGQINDGEEHSVAAIREANGMLKLYIDGELASSLYDEEHLNEQVKGGKITVGSEAFCGAVANIQILNRAKAYDEMIEKVGAESDRRDIPLDVMTATAGSEDAGTAGSQYGPAEYAIDGNENTSWMTEWNGYDTTIAAGKGWIDLKFSEPYTVDGLRYLPCKEAVGGTFTSITTYEVYVKTADSDKYEMVATGNWDNTTGWKMTKFDAVENVTNVKLLATEANSTNWWAIAAEIRVTGEKYDGTVSKVNKEELGMLIEESEALNPEDYVDFAEVIEALAKAKAVYADKTATQEAVDAAADWLAEALENLEEVPVKEDAVIRLFGTSRYETGIAVADELKAVLGVEKFETAIVATGTNFADALSGSYLASVKNAPILLTNGKKDNVAQLCDYIKANVTEGGKVYILGGTGAVSKNVEDAVKTAGYTVKRISGSSRYETSLMILEEAGITGSEIIVATGKNFADSLSASATGRPIMLVKPDESLSTDQKAVLNSMNGATIFIVGGTGVVSETIEKELAGYGEIVRLAGKGRYETSVKIAETFFDDVTTAVVASGTKFPDGLCGGPLAAALNAPLILTKDGAADAASGYVAENGIASGYVLGGNGALSDETVMNVFALESTEDILGK